MTLASTLQAFRAATTQCDLLIAEAHATMPSGVQLLSPASQRQITVAAFLNLYISWETFIEEAMAKLMAGDGTIQGALPTRYAVPRDERAARAMVIGVRRYFDYGNLELVRKLSTIYFWNGYPFEPHLSALASTVADIKTMRNASAHMSSTTQTALEGLALRILGRPCPGIDLYTFLLSAHPRSTSGATIYGHIRSQLLVAAELISNG